MASSSERVLEDLQRVIAELRERISDIEQAARHDVRRGVRAAERVVRDHTWQSLGTVAAVAFLAGLLLGRRD